MDRSEASALADLQMHWDEAYVISLDGDVWSARYRGSADELRAHTCGELRDLIRSDYAYRQKAGLVAYDPDGDEDDGVGDGADDQAEAGDDGTDGSREQHPDTGATERPDAEAGKFAALRGERMSI